MGLRANYIGLSKTRLDEFIDLFDNAEDENEIFNGIEELSEDETIDLLDIDKLWDSLHFLLTDKSALAPISNAPLSEAIVGISVADTEDFIAIIEPKDISNIVQAINGVNIQKLLFNIDPEKFEKADIYPNIWQNLDLESFKEELRITFEELVSFYEEILKKNQGVLISIY